MSGWGHRKPPPGWPIKVGHPLVPNVAYIMNEGGGLKIFNASPKRVIGNFSGDPTWTTGKNGSAIDFDGNDYIDAGTSYEKPTTGMTVSVLIKADTLTNHDMVVCDTSVDTLQRGWGMEYFGGDLRFYINHWDNQHAAKAFTDTLGFHRVFGIYDKSDIRIFVDNIEGTPDSYADDINYAPGSDGLFIAKGYSNNNWDGLIGEILIWNRALLDSEREKLRVQPYCWFKDPFPIEYMSFEAAGPPSGNPWWYWQRNKMRRAA